MKPGPVKRALLFAHVDWLAVNCEQFDTGSNVINVLLYSSWDVIPVYIVNEMLLCNLSHCSVIPTRHTPCSISQWQRV